MQPEVSVIVVTWNARDLVDRCLAAVLGPGGDGVDLELIVVDNASTDDTVAHVRSRWATADPRVRVVETGTNAGMAAGNNAGMLAAHPAARAFLLLNSDAFLEPGALRTLLTALDARPAHTTAAVVPALRNLDGSPQRSVRGWPTPWRYATELLYLRRLAPRSRAFNAFYGGGLDLSAPREIDWATGACLLVPRDAVDAVGTMDESYVMYGEEVDWLRRMHRTGRRVAWEPRAATLHVGGGSAKREWGRLYTLQLENHVRYVARNESPRTARRVRRLLIAALTLRAGAYRAAAVVPAGDRTGRRQRAAAFARGAAAVRAIDPAAPGDTERPEWPVQRPGA